MNQSYYVYQLVDPRTQKPFYIGKGTGQRDHSHLRRVLNGNPPNGNPYLDNRMKKILSLGLSIPCVRLAENLTENEAFELEVEEIRKHGIRGVGCLCNLTTGGEGPSGRKMTPEQIEANRQRALKNFADPKYRLKYESGRNAVNWEVVRKRQSETLRRRFSDPTFLSEHRERMKRAHSSYDAVKANSDRIIAFYKSHPEHRGILSNIQKRLWEAGHYDSSRVKEWTFISPDGNVNTFLNLSSFCREQHLTEANMRAVAAGRRKTHKGWTT